MKTLEMKDLMVLLVEPSVTQRHIVEKYMENLGITRLDVVRKGEDALALLRQNRPDVVISALYLPDMTGTDLVSNMRHDDTLSETAFILISSETSFKVLDPIRQAGAISIIPKPFSECDLKISRSATLDYLDAPPIALENIDSEDLQVLVVDDSNMARKHIIRILEAMGVEKILTAEDGAVAAEMLHSHYVDLVITDFNMPNMSGLDLVRHIRDESSQPGVPILMVTSESEPHQLQAVQDAGVSALCDKPFEPMTLKDHLEAILTE